MASASMPFAATFSSSPLQSIAEKARSYSPTLQSLGVSLASFRLSPLASSRSGFLQHGFSLQSQKLVGVAPKTRSFGVFATAATEKSIHDFTVKDIDGNDVSLSKFKGKVLLIVNVASRCGLTSSNYSELSHIYEKYKAQGKPYTNNFLKRTNKKKRRRKIKRNLIGQMHLTLLLLSTSCCLFILWK
ncbi:unnamed protein product [Linum tenue]|uniref:Glutathione peroxidase n=1 Tax=Linum tenue TaxID=586396 RepID=A0AAV0LWZ3_9ROSI|nr:unnamed protein product [Linum tenue]